MSFCRFGNAVLPNFYIIRVPNDCLHFDMLGDYHELDGKQVEHLRLILLEWILRGVLEGWLKYKLGSKKLNGWAFSSKTSNKKDVLAIKFPSIDVSLSFGQVLCLRSILENWLIKNENKRYGTYCV